MLRESRPQKATVNTPLTSRASLAYPPSASNVWKSALRRPVERFQSPTTPTELIEMAIPSSACRTMDVTLAEASAVDLVSIIAPFGEEPPICQNLTDLSLDAEMTEEENTIEEMLFPWTTKVSMWVAGLVTSQT